MTNRLIVRTETRTPWILVLGVIGLAGVAGLGLLAVPILIGTNAFLAAGAGCPGQQADCATMTGGVPAVQAPGGVPAVRAPAQAVATAISFAEQQLGKPYLWGGTGPDAFDCSGLVMMAYRAAGISIARTSEAQWATEQRVPASQVQPGDLVFFAGSDGTPTSPGHVGLVIGNGKMIEAYATGFPVRVSAYGQPSSPAGEQDPIGFTRPRAPRMLKRPCTPQPGQRRSHAAIRSRMNQQAAEATATPTMKPDSSATAASLMRQATPRSRRCYPLGRSLQTQYVMV